MLKVVLGVPKTPHRRLSHDQFTTVFSVVKNAGTLKKTCCEGAAARLPNVVVSVNSYV
jgi:hypothetical protein